MYRNRTEVKNGEGEFCRCTFQLRTVPLRKEVYTCKIRKWDTGLLTDQDWLLYLGQLLLIYPPQRGFGKEHPLLGTSLLSTGSLKVIADRTQRCSYLLVSSLRPSQKFFTNWQNYLPTVLTSYLVPQSTASGWEAEASLTLGF